MKSKVIFTYNNVEVNITVDHDSTLPTEEIIGTAIHELSFIHDIDVQFLGDWKVEVSCEQP